MFQQFFLISSCVLGIIFAFNMEKRAICGGLLEKPALDVDRKMENTVAKKGSTVVLECGFFAVPQASILWFHRGKTVQAHKAANIESFLTNNQLGQSVISSKLRIDCLDESTSGEYFCQASSPCSPTVVTSALVTIDRTSKNVASPSCKSGVKNGFPIQSVPIINLFTMSRIELPGGVVQLACRASGYPTPQIKWQRIEEDESLTSIDVSHSGFRQLKNGDLLVVGDASQIADSFRCTAENENGAVYEESQIIYMDQ